MQVSLVVKKGPTAGETFAITGNETVIGRSPKVQIPIPDDTKSSRRHAMLTVSDGKLQVADLGSANGTVVNGAKIDGTVQLYHGDKLLVGLTLFVVEAPELSRTAGAAPAPSGNAGAPLADGPDAMEETRRVVVDDSGQPTGEAAAPAAPAARPTSGVDDLGDELELDFDESGKPATTSRAAGTVPPGPDADSPPVDRKELARRKARERAEAAAAAEKARAEAAAGKAKESPAGDKGADKDRATSRSKAADPAAADAKAGAKGDGVEWGRNDRGILRAKGQQRPNLVQRALGDMGPLTSDFGSQPFHIQLAIGTVLLALVAGMFGLGMWMFGGCEPDNAGGDIIRPVTPVDPDE